MALNAKPGPIMCLNEAHGNNWTLYHGDCVEVMRQMPDNCIDFSLFSPPFANLYTYSASERDMGNCVDDNEFFQQYAFAVEQLHRIMRPGRCVSVHCKDLVNYKNSSGMAGLRDFPGELIRIHTDAGFSYHSKVTIWKCPVREMQRTKAHGLLYKQLRKDSSFSRQGLAEYLITFRKWARDERDEEWIDAVTHTKDDLPLEVWQEYASPVWMTVNQTRVLNVQQARDDRDEKHICPLQLDVIERALTLWSNPGDVVFSPFAGMGSEGHGALRYRRKFIGTELKDSYFEQAKKNLSEVEPGGKNQQLGLSL